MNVCLKTDIKLVIRGKETVFKAGELILVDPAESIAYHKPSDFYFDVDPKEYSYLN